MYIVYNVERQRPSVGLRPRAICILSLIHILYTRRVRYLGMALLSLCLVLSIANLALCVMTLVIIGFIPLRSDKGVVVALGRSYSKVNDPSRVDVDT